MNAGAHILLPAAAWGEKDGTVTNSERRISRQRRFLPLPGEAKPDWWIVSEVARRMGFADAFAYECAADIFREHAALSAFENNGTRDFDLGGLAQIDDDAFDALEPVTWPARDGAAAADTRFFAEGGFFTADRKARFIAPEAPALRDTASNAYPFILNTGRVRDQWHTMTRTGLSPRLGQHTPEPFVEIHPEDADALGLQDFARVVTAHGDGVFRVRVSEGQQRGSLFAPIHWNGETASSARAVRTCRAAHRSVLGAAGGEGDAGVNRAGRIRLPRLYADAHAGRAARGHMVVARRAERRRRLPARIQRRRRGAGANMRARWSAKTAPNSSICARGIYRAAAFRDGRLDAALFIGPAETAPQWDAIKALFEAQALTDIERRMALSGRAADGLAETGPVICACFGVGLNVIRDAITSKSAANVEAIGKALRAGTNCGSCLPELKRIVHEHAHAS